MTRPSITELFDLSGKTAIVSASGQGMGQGIAFRLADAGANIVVSHRHMDKAEETAAAIRAEGGKAVAALTDVTNLDQIQETVKIALDSFGAIDILVNNAGGMHPFTPFLDVTPEMFQSTIDRNVTGTYFFTQAVARAMVEAKRPGNIVNIASTASARPDMMVAAYNASKAAVVSLTQSLSVELAPYGILVKAVSPGPIRTTATEGLYADPGISQMISQRILLGAAGVPDDIAAAVLFCCAPASKHMTGSNLVIDGGYVLT
jgi:NAD(P)-dependent dehydrogenase (short-subunit alcohol dehydrogenase family)